MKSFLLICLFATIFSKVVYDLEQVRKDLLDRHNYYRAKHQAPNLERLAALDTIAQSYSEKLASLGYLVQQNQLMLGMMKSKIIVSKNPNSLLELDTLLKLSGKILDKLDVVLLAIAKIIAMLLATIIQEVIILVNSEPMFFL